MEEFSMNENISEEELVNQLKQLTILVDEKRSILELE